MGGVAGVELNYTDLQLYDERFSTSDDLNTYLQTLYTSGNPLTLYVKTPMPTIEEFDFDNTYIVWDKGFEQVLTPEDENGFTCFDYGANTTEENTYYTII